MKYAAIFSLIFSSSLAYGEGIRSSLSDTADRYLREQIPAEEVVQRAKAEQKVSQFNEEERLYLEDLTKRLPEAIQTELCPSFEKGLCENAPYFKIWDEVPKLAEMPLEKEPEKSWLSRNKKWLTALVIGGIGLTAYSLRNKEIQLGSASR